MLAILLLQIVSVLGSASRDGEVVSYDRFGKPDVQIAYENRTGETALEPVPVSGKVTLQDGRVFTADISTFEKIYDTESVDTYRGWATFVLNSQSILGLHVWETCRADGTIEVAFTVSNGTVPFTGGVYYKSIELHYRSNYGVFGKPRLGEVISPTRYSVVGSGNHYFPARFEFTRRFVFYKKGVIRYGGDDQLAKRVFGKEFVRLPAVFANFGPTKSSYRTLAGDGKIASETLRIYRALESGQSDPSVDIQRIPYGPFALMGYSEPGAVGGTGIRPTVRNNPSMDYARNSYISADVRQERMPIAAYSREDGYPMRPDRWARGGASQGFEYRLTRGLDGIVQIPEFPSAKKFNSGTCAYEYDLVRTFADDEQHLGRYAKLQQDCIWMLNDPVSKHRIQMVAADCQMSWTIYGLPPFEKRYDGEWLPFSLQSDLIMARKNPGKGSRVLRSTGWTLDAVSSAIAISPPGNVRREHLKWARQMADLVEITVLPNGIGIDGRNPYADNGQPWNTYGMPTNYGAAPMFQVPIWANGIYGLTKNVPWDTASLARKTILRSADCIYFLTPKVASVWGGNAVGPPYYLVVSRNGIPTQEVTEGFGKSHWIHCWHHLALAYKLTGEAKYITAMSTVGAPGNNLLEAFSTATDRTWLIEAEEVLLERAVRR